MTNKHLNQLFAKSITTAHINSAVVKLSAIGEIKKDCIPNNEDFH